MKRGIVTGAIIVAAGVLLQFLAGSFRWDAVGFPVNCIILFLFLSAIAASHLSRDRYAFLRRASSPATAVTSIGWCVVLTVITGLVRQEPSSEDSVLSLHNMLSHWSFLLAYTWMTFSLGMTVLRVCIPLKAARIPFLLNHLGLFLALTCGAAGAADLVRLKVSAEEGIVEQQAYDSQGIPHRLPFTMELVSFDMDEYPPKLILADIRTGAYLPEGSPAQLEVEDAAFGDMGEWRISVLKYIPEAIPTGAEANSSSLSGIPFTAAETAGAYPAVQVSALSEHGDTVTGWVASGSAFHPHTILKLDDGTALCMTEREARRYVSVIKINDILTDTVEVNSPCRFGGWKIYQAGYDRRMGRHSRTSVFEIVRDPWMPGVYAGILMLAAGAVCMFVQFGTKKRKEEER